MTLHYFETAPLAGVLGGPGTYRGAAGSRDRGAWVQFDVRAGAGIIETVRFLAFGCPHIIAVSAWVAEHAAGCEIKAALPESVRDLSERFTVPPEKKGRLLIIEDAWMAAMHRALTP